MNVWGTQECLRPPAPPVFPRSNERLGNTGGPAPSCTTRFPALKGTFGERRRACALLHHPFSSTQMNVWGTQEGLRPPAPPVFPRSNERLQSTSVDDLH